MRIYNKTVTRGTTPILVLSRSLTAICFLAVALAGQEGPHETSAPVPYLLPGGTVPDKEKKQTVFLDPDTGDAVAIYRPSADGKVSETATRVKIPLSRNTDPSIGTGIEYDEADKEFRYKYVLRNGAKARQPAYIWLFVDVVDQKTIRVEHPSMWLARFPERVSDANIIFHSLAIMVRNPPIDATNLPSVPGIFPRQMRAGLKLVSTRLPGVVEVYVQGRAEIAAFPDEPPDAVTVPLARVMGFPFNYKRTLAFGPKYSDQLSKAELAVKFNEDLERLAEAGLIDRRGEFFVTAKRLFGSFQSELELSNRFGGLEKIGRSAKEREFLAAAELAFVKRKD